MSAQKWVSPAGSPLTATTTATGPSGQAIYTKQYGASGDLNVGTAIEIAAFGNLTTTGSPTIGLTISGFSNDVNATLTAITDAAGDTWTIKASFTIRAINADDTIDYAYAYEVDGIEANKLTSSGIVTAASPYDAALGLSFTWSTADSGDEITITQAYGKWIG